jgi:adenylate cyclase
MKLNLWDILSRLQAVQAWLIRPWVLGLGVGVVVVLISFSRPVEIAELKLYDTHMRSRGNINHRREIVLVDISERTFDEIPHTWPYRRAWIAQAIEKIQTAKPRVVGLDMLFTEPSPFGRDDDAALAATLKKYSNVVLGALRVTEQAAVYTGAKEPDIHLPTKQIKLPIKAFRETPSGMVNTLYSVDGFVRRAPLSMRFRDEDWPSFAKQLYEVATREGIRVRLPPGEEILINFRGPTGTFDTRGFHQVYRPPDLPDEFEREGQRDREAERARQDEFDPNVFRGRIVLIGASAPALHDVFNTPFASRELMPGVEIQANALDNLLRGDPIRPAGKLPPVALAIVAAVVATFVASRLSPVKGLVIVVTLGAAYAIAAYISLGWYRLWLEEVPVQLALIGPYVAVAVRNYVFDNQDKRRLARFFSPAVAQDILKHGAVLRTQRRKVTILFSDIRNFTTISEKLAPELVVQALRLNFNTMTPIIFRNGGSVDKFVGDCIMAFFNAPIDDPQHADHAVKAAVEMVHTVESLSPHWEQMTGYPLKIGVGINTGEVVIGTMGSDDRLEYSCIGDAVNLAARLESATKEVRRDIVISEYTVKELTEEFGIRPVQEIHVKGRAEPVQVYSVETGMVADEPELRTLVDATLQTISGTQAPTLMRRR